MILRTFLRKHKISKNKKNKIKCKRRYGSAKIKILKLMLHERCIVTLF